MSIWPFNRKNKQEQSIVAGEVQDYYQSERRERKGVAWLLAIATFLVTLFAVLVLFYGGKWAYNKIRGDDSNTAEIVEEQTPEQANQGEQNSQNQDQNQTESGNTSSGSNQSGNVNGQSDTPQTSSTSTSTPSPSTTATPVTGPASEELPRTGPDQDL